MSDTLILPALGQDIQLGMLYDARTARLHAGFSLWDNAVVNKEQDIDDSKIQDAAFSYSYSLQEARSKAGLDIEGSLNLDFGLVKATGSARYLNDQRSAAFEARMDVSCTIVRRTRRIPQELLATDALQHTGHLNNPRFTHFVAEVTEGGAATLSFVQSCDSSEHVKTVLGNLKGELAKLPVGGSTKAENSEQSSALSSRLNITYNGAIAESVTSIDDARRIAHEMPIHLRKQFNALSYTLYPLEDLDNTASRAIRKLDDNLVQKTVAGLNAGEEVGLQMKDLLKEDVFRKFFPKIKRQIENVLDVFSAAKLEFEKTVRIILPQLRDGTSTVKQETLEAAIALFQQRTRFAKQFHQLKIEEAGILQNTIVDELLGTYGFKNCFSERHIGSLLGEETPHLLLSLGGKDTINRTRHPLGDKIKSAEVITYDSDSTDEGDDPGPEEWFNNWEQKSRLRTSCSYLKDLKAQQLVREVVCGVASIDSAYLPGAKKRRKTALGDILLYSKGEMHIVTNALPGAPDAPILTARDQGFGVAWAYQRPEAEEALIPATGITVKYRPLSGSWRHYETIGGSQGEALEENEMWRGFESQDMHLGLVIGEGADARLFGDCEYEVSFRIKTMVGYSPWSPSAVIRTIHVNPTPDDMQEDPVVPGPKLPPVATRINSFYFENRADLFLEARQRPWEMHKSETGHQLHLGLKTLEERIGARACFMDNVAVRVLDVAAGFEPECHAASIQDFEKTVVVVFAGPSGHGKYSQINEFVGHLLEVDLQKAAHLIVVGGHETVQGQDSEMQPITCYRVRPHSSRLNGKTVLVADIPSFGDSIGLRQRLFRIHAVYMFFQTVTHVNAIILTCRATATTDLSLSHTTTFMLSILAKSLHKCLRTIYTFSDGGIPDAQKALQDLRWPVANGEVALSNVVSKPGGKADGQACDKGGKRQHYSVQSQEAVLSMVMGMAAASISHSIDLLKTLGLLECQRDCTEGRVASTPINVQSVMADIKKVAVAGGRQRELLHSQEKKLLNKLVEFESLRKICGDIERMVDLTTLLRDSAIQYDLFALDRYLDWQVIQDNQDTSPAEQLSQLSKKRKVRVMLNGLMQDHAKTLQCCQALLTISSILSTELKKAGQFPTDSLEEDERRVEICTLFDNIWDHLPAEVQLRTPVKPSEVDTSMLFWWRTSYKESLEAIVRLIEFLVVDGGLFE
ncbi:hypothetical protein QBC40DRAFT_223695 [Triangularia verruculosa]|uniref:Uncharacterized protein n=1 Tax=Triangularia verruculosa TaxID=2587418 RepID=A0AAN7AWU8_9PEZI|nr:hypothetical protein QBC40DRAFT_223695 [Triangularia verruculosa]